jgi:hypothetical protein
VPVGHEPKTRADPRERENQAVGRATGLPLQVQASEAQIGLQRQHALEKPR